MNPHIDQAVAMFDEGYSCAQSLLGVYGPLFGLDRENALRLAAPFAGGISRTDGPCGAVTGAILVLGLKYGHSHPDDEAGADRIRQLTRDFLARYRERKGSTLCTDILGANLSVPADLERVEAGDLYDVSCPDAVRTAACLLEEMLAEPEDSQP
jgi:C_GCAxxG_C_C family probable redox protein